MARRIPLFGGYVHLDVGKSPPDTQGIPIVDKNDEIVENLDAVDISSLAQLNEFRTLAQDRNSQYNAYDDMSMDSIIAAALEIYADDATQSDEQGRIIWVESEDDNISRAGNRLLDVLEIPERAWKHIYQACKYGDYYLKLYREDDFEDSSVVDRMSNYSATRVINDKVVKNDLEYVPRYVEYVEDVEDPSTIFDLQKRGRTAGFVEVEQDSTVANQLTKASSLTGIKGTRKTTIYRPDRFVHIKLAENLTRYPEEVILDFGDQVSATYKVASGKSILQDVYPIQKELQLLEDSLLLNRLTRSSLIRLLEIEVGDMPKKEVNNYLRRVKQLVEQHIAFDKGTGDYKSFQAPGPVDNVIYIPTKNGKGSVSVNTLGGDVNVRDIADIDYFSNKRAGSLKIPRAYLGDDMEGSGLSNGGSLTRQSIRYARTVKRCQTAYIRAITQLLNLYFVDKKLDYVNKFTVRMTSPSTQEDLERNELIQGNVELVKSVMELTGSLQGATQKKVLHHLVSNVLKMPELADFIEEDTTPSEDIDIEGGGSFGGFDTSSGSDLDLGGSSPEGTVDMSGSFGGDDSSEGFTDAEYDSFEDELPGQ